MATDWTASLRPVPVGTNVESRLPSALSRAIRDRELPPLRHFVLPGGTRGAAALHLARCVCRRAERRAVALAGASEVTPPVLTYLNRLSDFLFVAARVANRRAGMSTMST